MTTKGYFLSEAQAESKDFLRDFGSPSTGSGHKELFFYSLRLPLTSLGKTRMSKRLPPVHPGEVLNEEFLVPFRLSQYRVAKNLGVPPRRINEIILGERAVTVDTALRLSRYFGTTPEFWLNLQARYELESVGERLMPRIWREVPEFSAVG